MNRIPSEILNLILKQLNGWDLVHCSLVNLLWLSNVQPLLFKAKRFSIPDLVPVLELANMKRISSKLLIPSPASFVRILDSTMSEAKLMTDELVFRFQSLHSTLVIIKLINCYLLTPVAISILMRGNALITNLEVSGCSLESTMAAIELSSSLSLDSIVIHSLFPDAILLKTNARYISLSKPMSKIPLQDALDCDLRRVKTLKLININVDLDSVWPSKTSLNDFEWDGAKLSTLFFSALLNSCQFQRLSITSLDVDINCIRTLITSASLNTLEWLKLSKCITLTSEMILMMANFKKLKYLDLSGNVLDRGQVMALLDSDLSQVTTLCI